MHTPAITRGTSSATLTDPTVATDNHVFNGATGGVQAGYNWRLNSGLLLGVEGDISFPNYMPSNHVVSSPATALTVVEERWDYVASLRARLGYATGNWLFYATGGAAFAGERFLSTPIGGNEEKVLNTRLRLDRRRRRRIRLRAALERAARISLQQVRERQRHLPVGRTIFVVDGFPEPADRPQSQDRLAGRADLQSEVRRDRHRIEPLGDPRPVDALAQGYPAFRAPYTGPNSLLPSPAFSADLEQLALF